DLWNRIVDGLQNNPTAPPSRRSGHRDVVPGIPGPDTSNGMRFYVLLFNTWPPKNRWEWDQGSLTMEEARTSVNNELAVNNRVAGIYDTKTGQWVMGGPPQASPQPADLSLGQWKALIDEAKQRLNVLKNQFRGIQKGWLTQMQFDKYNQAVDDYNSKLQRA